MAPGRDSPGEWLFELVLYISLPEAGPGKIHHGLTIMGLPWHFQEDCPALVGAHQ